MAGKFDKLIEGYTAAQKAEVAAEVLGSVDPTGETMETFFKKLEDTSETVYLELLARAGERSEEHTEEDEETGTVD